MPNANPYILYHTEGCHLCELAQALLAQARCQFSLVDICDDLHLAECYGTSIPVVKAINSGQELPWPFDFDQLTQFLGA